MSDDCLIEKVRWALNNAKDNGYEIGYLSSDEVARDLKMYDADLEDEDFCQISIAVGYVRVNG